MAVVQASNGMVKHILANEANTAIQEQLLQLANEEVKVDRKIIYDQSNSCENHTLSRLHVSTKHGLNSSKTRTTMSDFASKFNVKDETSKTNGSGSKSNGSVQMSAARATTSLSKSKSKPAFISIGAKKKVVISQMSSMASNGSHETTRLQEVAIEGGNVDENISDVV